MYTKESINSCLTVLQNFTLIISGRKSKVKLHKPVCNQFIPIIILYQIRFLPFGWYTSWFSKGS